MLRLLIVSIFIKIVVPIDFSLLESNEAFATYNDLIDVFGDSLNNSRPVQLERIKNAPPQSSNKKHDIAKTFLKHYNSPTPVAVLVDDTKEAYNDASNFMKSVFELTPNTHIDFFILKFNETGVTPPLQINANNLEHFLNYTFEHEFSYLGPTKSNGTAAFFAILNAAAILPTDGAILIFIDRKIADEDLASHTSIIKKKNIKVYVIWGGEYPTKSSEDYLLREICVYSGGLFLDNTYKNLSNYNYRLFLENEDTQLNTSIILSKSNLLGSSDFTFPVDSKVTGIHIRVSPFIESGSLSPPKGYTIDILENDEIADYSTGSFGLTDPGLHEVYLNIATAPTHGVGVWRLKLNNTRALYNVTVFVYTKLTVHAYIQKNAKKNHSSYTQNLEMVTRHARETAYQWNGLALKSVGAIKNGIRTLNSQNITGNVQKIMKLGISGYITSISNISFVGHNGQALSDKAKYTLAKDWLVEKNDSSSYQNREVDVEINNISEQPVYALIQGKDGEGLEFARLAYINSYNTNDIFPKPALTVDVGLGSELITSGGTGTSPVILFEVTNHKNTAVDVRFYCRDSKSVLRSMQPYRKIIAPEETATVRVTLITRAGTYQDEIEFSATVGAETFTKKVLVDVGTQVGYDNVDPDVDYTFSGDCSKVIFSECQDGTWTIKVKARDNGSGLLQVVTVPKGIYFPNGFTTGTKEQVEGIYSDSCCSPDLQIIAVDRQNNRRIVNVNAYRAFWGPAQIAALVLGILLFILIIILIGYCIYRCVRNREDYNLPTYRGGRI